MQHSNTISFDVLIPRHHRRAVPITCGAPVVTVATLRLLTLPLAVRRTRIIQSGTMQGKHACECIYLPSIPSMLNNRADYQRRTLYPSGMMHSSRLGVCMQVPCRVCGRSTATSRCSRCRATQHRCRCCSSNSSSSGRRRRRRRLQQQREPRLVKMMPGCDSCTARVPMTPSIVHSAS
jgi:hypothetical protein